MQAIIALLLVGPLAQAEEATVIYPGDDPSMAVTRVSATTELDAESIKPVTLSDITVGGSPVLYGPGEAASCGGVASTMSALRGAVKRAESGVAYMEFDQAKAHLKTAVNALACLNEPVHPDTGSRLHYLQGILLHADGDNDSALAAYKKAHHYSPGLTWDDYFPPDSVELFDAAGAAVKSSVNLTLAVIPAPAEGALWVDGRSVTTQSGILSLVEGEHLIQVVGNEAITVSLTLSPHEASGESSKEEPTEPSEGEAAEEVSGSTQNVTHTLVVPTAVTNTDLTWADNEVTRKDLDTILTAALGSGGIVYIPLGATVWTSTLGSGTWEALEVPTNAMMSTGAARRVMGQSLLYGGAGIAAGSGLYAALNYVRARDYIKNGTNANKWDHYELAHENYEKAKSNVFISELVLTGGVVLAGGGWLLQRNMTVSPWVDSSSSGLHVTWTIR